MTRLTIGTRASVLARTQSQSIADSLTRALGVTVELVPVVSEGDRSSAPLTEIGGQGVFVGAVRDALVAGDVDLVVHSLKDLPTFADERVHLAAVPARDDSRDALVARDGMTLGELPAGSTVGTGSPRRAAQLNALGLGVDVVPVRGNVDTRLATVTSGKLDAVLLARAGLVRLGRQEEITEVLDPIQMLPAPGQGALAVEVVAGAEHLSGEIAGVLDDSVTRAAVTAERTLLRTLEAGCLAPVGALAEVAEGEDGLELWLRAVVVSPDGSRAVRLSAVGSVTDPAEVGDRLAKEMLAQGADSILQEQAT